MVPPGVVGPSRPVARRRGPRGSTPSGLLAGSGRAGGGFTLVEVLVALSLVATVMLSSTVYLVRVMSVTRHQSDMQVAMQLATDAMERMRSLPARTLLAGRTADLVATQLAQLDPTSALSVALRDTEPAIDSSDAVRAMVAVAVPAAPASAAALPTAPQTVVVNGLPYEQEWYVGRCWIRRTDGDCTISHKTALSPVALLRVFVAVSWPSKDCPDESCVFTTSTLVDEALASPILSPPPVVSSPPVTPAQSVTAVSPSSVTPTPSLTAVPVPVPVPVPVTPTPTPPPPPPNVPLSFPMVWANQRSGDDDALMLGGAGVTIIGSMHSNSGITIQGAAVDVRARIEYATTLTISSAGSITSPAGGVKVLPSTPRYRDVADYRPDGPAAIAAGAGYRQMPCQNGSWTYSAAAVGTATVIYVPCAVKASGASVLIIPLVVAEGSIDVRGVTTLGDPENLGAGGLVSNSTGTKDSPAINVGGATAYVYSTIEAMNGHVDVSGASLDAFCPIIADTIRLRAARNSFTASSECAPTM